MTAEPPRGAEQRKRDLLAHLEHDVDIWVASSSKEGNPYLVPLSFLWDGKSIIVATIDTNPTGRNMRASGRVRLGLGPTRDVAVIDAIVAPLSKAEIPPDVADAFAKKCSFDPRMLRSYNYYVISPTSIQAWRESNELAGRELMRDGSWVI